MDAPQNTRPDWLPPEATPPPNPAGAPRGKPSKKALVSVGAAMLLALKFGAKLKFVLLPALKFFPVLLKTGGTMILSIGLYAITWGWQFAVGFVFLMLVHECGHLLAAKRIGLKVGAPVFIPFMGAIIALKEAPPNAWIEAQVGMGGPLLGSVGAALCEGIYQMTGQPVFRALAYSGFFLNLFNLAPLGFLDGGRIVTALSPWLWIVGLVIVGAMLFTHPNFLLILIVLMSVPRVISLFRRKTAQQQRYYEVSPARRLLMAALYFGLIALLLLGMKATHIQIS
jgi:Zn-dependent protease